MPYNAEAILGHARPFPALEPMRCSDTIRSAMPSAQGGGKTPLPDAWRCGRQWGTQGRAEWELATWAIHVRGHRRAPSRARLAPIGSWHARGACQTCRDLSSLIVTTAAGIVKVPGRGKLVGAYRHFGVMHLINKKPRRMTGAMSRLRAILPESN